MVEKQSDHQQKSIIKLVFKVFLIPLGSSCSSSSSSEGWFCTSISSSSSSSESTNSSPPTCKRNKREIIVVTQPFPPGLTRHIRNNGCITILLLEKTKMIVSPVVNSKQNYFSTLHKMVSDILAIFSNIHWHHISVLTILSKLKNFSWFCSAVHTWNLAKEFFHSFLFYYSSTVDFLFPLP